MLPGARGHLPVAAGDLLLHRQFAGAAFRLCGENLAPGSSSRSSCCSALSTKGFWLQPKEVRDLIDDENTRANRIEAMRWRLLVLDGDRDRASMR